MAPPVAATGLACATKEAHCRGADPSSTGGRNSDFYNVLLAITLKRRKSAGARIAAFVGRVMKRAEHGVREERTRAAVRIQRAVRGMTGRRRARIYRQRHLRTQRMVKLGLSVRPLRRFKVPHKVCSGRRRLGVGAGKAPSADAKTAPRHGVRKGSRAAPMPAGSATRLRGVGELLVRAVVARRGLRGAEQARKARVLPIHAKRTQIFQNKQKIIALRRQQESRKARLQRHRRHILASRRRGSALLDRPRASAASSAMLVGAGAAVSVRAGKGIVGSGIGSHHAASRGKKGHIMGGHSHGRGTTNAVFSSNAMGKSKSAILVFERLQW